MQPAVFLQHSYVFWLEEIEVKSGTALLTSSGLVISCMARFY